jgi:hypothetical protein
VSAYVGGAEESIEASVSGGQLLIDWPDGLELTAGGDELTVRIEW